MPVKGRSFVDCYLNEYKSVLTKGRYAEIHPAVNKGFFIDTAGSIFKRKALEDAGYFDENLKRVEDLELTQRICDCGYSLAVAEDALAKVAYTSPCPTFLYPFRSFQNGWSICGVAATKRGIIRLSPKFIFRDEKLSFPFRGYDLINKTFFFLAYYARKLFPNSAERKETRPRKGIFKSSRLFVFNETYFLSPNVRFVVASKEIRFYGKTKDQQAYFLDEGLIKFLKEGLGMNTKASFTGLEEQTRKNLKEMARRKILLSGKEFLTGLGS